VDDSQTKGYLVVTRSIGEVNWSYLVDLTDASDIFLQGFVTEEEAQEFIDDFMPPGWEARVIPVDMTLIMYQGTKH